LKRSDSIFLANNKYSPPIPRVSKSPSSDLLVPTVQASGECRNRPGARPLQVVPPDACRSPAPEKTDRPIGQTVTGSPPLTSDRALHPQALEAGSCLAADAPETSPWALTPEQGRRHSITRRRIRSMVGRALVFVPVQQGRVGATALPRAGYPLPSGDWALRKRRT
jgi:anti-sigma factor RsiW